MVMTGHAKIASATHVAIVTRSEKSSNAARARGGNNETTTSMRIWRPIQPTGPMPRKTQPIIKKSIAISATAPRRNISRMGFSVFCSGGAHHLQHVVHGGLILGRFVAHGIEQR